VRRQGALDFEAAEFYVRSAVHGVGVKVLERLLHELGSARRSAPLMCAHNHPPVAMRSTGLRVKTVETILGPARLERSRLKCPRCGAVAYPGDELVGVKGTGFSPGSRRLMTRIGSRESFGEAAGDLREYAGVQFGAKDIERVAEETGRQIDRWMRQEASAAQLREAASPAPACCEIVEPAEHKAAQAGPDPSETFYVELDGTGVPVRKSELAHSKGKAPDGRARTREAKLGCVFTQTALDEKGRPVRDPHSTSFVGAIESSGDFGYRLKAEAIRRGMTQAQRVVVLSDGADYNATIACQHFPNATHIIDLFHPCERLTNFIKDHTPNPVQGAFHRECLDLLEDGQIEQLAERMRGQLPARGPRRNEGQKSIAYFTTRAPHMRYAHFRRQGLFVGSGVIEAGCKTVIGARLKQSGMFWTVAGANAILAARCCLYSKRFEQFWEDARS
jgi:hypothetical protein